MSIRNKWKSTLEPFNRNYFYSMLANVIREMPGKPFTKKGWKIYEGLKKKGMSKTRAAKIASSKKGTRLKRKSKK